MFRLIILLPFLLALIVFSASNQDPLQMWVVSYGWKSSAGVLALVVGACGFLLGAFTVWVVELRQRRRARKAEAQIRLLESQIAEIRNSIPVQAPLPADHTHNTALPASDTRYP